MDESGGDEPREERGRGDNKEKEKYSEKETKRKMHPFPRLVTPPTSAALVPLSKVLHLHWAAPSFPQHNRNLYWSAATTTRKGFKCPLQVHSMWPIPTVLYQGTHTHSYIFRPGCWVFVE